MNDPQDNASSSLPSADLAETAEKPVVKRRSPRRKVVVDAAPAEVAPTAADVAAPMDAAPSVVSEVEAAAEAPAEPVKRRRLRKPVVAAEPVQSDVLSNVPSDVSSDVPLAGQTPVIAQDAQSSEDAPPQEGVTPAAVDESAEVAPTPVEGFAFADVVSGAYDAEDSAASEAVASTEPTKRVLSADADAPKLHKVLAQVGVGSRRDMEQLIMDGRVSVNGEPAHLGMRITYGDEIKVAGRVVKVRIAPPVPRILAYHKPVGEVVTHNDPEGRPTVFRRLPRLGHGKWLSVGRLDLNTEGLLLFTNSGELANQLMHPRFGVEREYAVRVLGTLDDVGRDRLLTGVDIEGQKASFKSIENGGGEGINHWYRVVITEGRNREVRKLFDAVGLTVSRLIRIRYASVVLPRGLKRGIWVELGEADVRQISRMAGIDPDQVPQRRERSAAPVRQQSGQDGAGRGPGRGGRQGGPTGVMGQAPQGQVERNERHEPQRGGQAASGRPGGKGQGGQPQRGGRPNDRGGDRQPPSDRQGERQGNGFQGRRPNTNPYPNEQRAEPRRQVVADDLPDDGPMHIPNPLEQTFDRRFATGSKRISSGFGRPTEEPIRQEAGRQGRGKGQGPKQPDPMQTSVGYIGADAYFTKPGGGGRRGGRR
ncbi:23S rRNA pseudouridine(2605) synthase RluB [Leptothrix ochracea]|uniref:23S rRNA pseudouridine(2605) synthase RluB n=2 Tax=Leptothrix ochracea TaxID=735331 RepID=UPI0034E1D85B